MATRFRISLLVTLTLATIALQAQTAPTVFPVPFTSSIAGMGAATTSTCSANILATDGNNYGDGCVGTLAVLQAPQGAAIDRYGNIYVADYTDRLVRVIYKGGASVAAAITAANSGYKISAGRNAPATVPVAGNIYTIAGVGAGVAIAAAASNTTGGFTATNSDGKYACANYAASGQADALNAVGDGCPAAAADIGARDVTVDNDGNLILTDYTNNRVRILCVNCTGTLAATLIETENSGVTPVNGAIYTVAGYTVGYRDQYLGFGNPTTAETTVSLLRSPTASAVSASEDIFIADNLNNAVRVLYNGGTAAKNILTAEGYTPTVGNVYTIAGSGCVGAALTKTGSVATANACLTTTGSDTAGYGTIPGATPATTTTGIGISTAWTVYLDANGNVYYTDAGNARIKVIYAGIAAPLTLPDATYATLKTGHTYSFAGQGALTISGVAPNKIKLTSAQGVGGDAAGNIFFIDYSTNEFFETYAQNGLTVLIGGGNGIAAASAVANAYCNGSAGPVMSDAAFDGCPFTQTTLSGTRGPIVADSLGNLYFGDSPGGYIRKFSYNSTFLPEPADTETSSQPFAFTSATTIGAAVVTEGDTIGSDFIDVGGDTCPTTVAGATCVVNVAFKPSAPGVFKGAVSPIVSGTAQGYSLITGTGTGPALTVDPSTVTTTGTKLTPAGIAVDGAANIYVSDTASGSVFRYTGGTPTTVATGFTAPTGVAVDGAGNIFIADSSANTITEVSALAPTTPFVVTTNVKDPHGITTDAAGNLYVADATNNRVLIFNPAASTGTYTIAGFTGLSAPQDVAIDLNGNLYTIDSTHVVKLTTAGVQNTVATSGGTAVAVDAAANVFLTTGTLLVEVPSDSAAVTLYSNLTTPQGLALDATGNAYIADSGIIGYEKFARTAGYYKFATNPGTAELNLTSAGTAAVASAAFTVSETTDYAVAAATTNGCSGSLAPGTTCALTAKYAGTSTCVTPDSIVFTTPVSNGAPGFTLTTTSVAPCLSVTALPATVTYGATVTLTADVSGTVSTGGTVIFYNGATQLASEPVTNGIATYSYIPTVNTYSVTATFTPSGASAPTLTSQPTSFTVNQAMPSISLSSVSPTSGYTTTTFTLIATVTAAYGTPTGSVSFTNGTTSLGSTNLVGGIATLPVSTLPAGADCISATYGSSSNFTTVSTSACTNISVAPGFSVIATSTALAFQSASYQEAQTFLTIAPGGRTDTLTFACSGLPAKLNCAFNPASLPLSGLTASQTVQLLVSNSSAQAAVTQPASTIRRGILIASLPMAALLLIGLRRRRIPAALLLAFLTLAGAAAVTGCGNSAVALEQPGGTYPFTVTVSNGTTTLQTINFTIMVP